MCIRDSSAGGLVALVHAVVEFLEERGVLVVVGVVVDVLHGIEAVSYTHLPPQDGRTEKKSQNKTVTELENLKNHERRK